MIVGAHELGRLFFRAQQAKSCELRAAMSNGAARRDRGSRTKGADLPAPVHGWFTEGFERPI